MVTADHLAATHEEDLYHGIPLAAGDCDNILIFTLRLGNLLLLNTCLHGANQISEVGSLLEVEFFCRLVHLLLEILQDGLGITIQEFDENGNAVKVVNYVNGAQNRLYTQEFNEHGDMTERKDDGGNAVFQYQYTYDDAGRKMGEEMYIVSNGEQHLDHSTVYTYDDTHEQPVSEVITNDNGVQTITREFDTMASDDLYIETISEEGADDAVFHKRVSDDKVVYSNEKGREVTTEYDEHGNVTKQAGKDSLMGNFEQTFENTYDGNGNMVSMKSTYNGDEGYHINYTYAALSDASYNGEGTLLFDAATDVPSAA